MDDFIGTEWKQNCGDSLRILEKTNQKGKDGSFLYRCKFLRYPFELLLSNKYLIRKGSINNPRIEEEEFINKLWPQNCGDILKVIEKTDKKTKEGHILFKARFQKYPYENFFPKGNIIKGTIDNPQIEQVEFIDKLWPQNCGDTLKIIKKSDKKEGTTYLWEAIFQKYSCKIIANKKNILVGQVDNPSLPWKSKENLEKYLKNATKKYTLKELANEFQLNHHTICNLINEFNLRDYILYYPTISFLEEELDKYINSFNIKIERSNWSILKDKEIDIYIPDLKLGFEFNGNYWHSNNFKENNYHQKKSILAKEKGIRLIHIWEWEWNNIEIIKSFIKSQLGIFNKKIGARKCIIKEISKEQYQDFCNKNHLQGSCGAKIKLGLFYKDELVQIMSFDIPRFTDKYEWEIIRECSKLGYIIIGGKEKLWSYFIKNYNPKNCISYCDFSKFTGDSYLKLGFKKERLNYPGFMWYDKSKNFVYPRSPWKHQEMKKKGYLKIYDAGQLVFIWNKNF